MNGITTVLRAMDCTGIRNRAATVCILNNGRNVFMLRPDLTF